MTGRPFDIVGFDLDGTLVDSGGDLATAVNHALTGIGRDPLPQERIIAMIGAGTRNMLAQAMTASGGCTDAELDALYNRMLEYYEAHIAVSARPYPGCLEALDELAGMGVRLAVVTNKLERLGRVLLDALGMTARFATVIGGDTMGPGNAKPSPAPIREMVTRLGGGSAAFVGDSRFDIEAAKAAGLPNIVCSFGFRQEPLENLGADAMIDGYGELVPTLRKLGA